MKIVHSPQRHRDIIHHRGTEAQRKALLLVTQKKYELK